MKVFIVLLAMLITGCASQPPATIPVNVAIPIKCQAEVPQRPVMPTEVLQSTAPFDRARAALAEIDFREGYELELVAALRSCL